MTTDELTIAIVDDEEDMRLSIAQFLSLSGHQTKTYENPQAALIDIGPDFPGLVISDIRMPGMDGMEFLKRLQGIDAAMPVIMITGHGDVTMAVDAMRIGAYDFVEKPFKPERLADLVKRAAATRRLTIDNRALRRELSDGTVLLRKLMGDSAQMVKLREDILDVAQADAPVLVSGETGTGKSLIAHALHACGPKQGNPFYSINCAALGEDELAEKLFGKPGGTDGPDRGVFEKQQSGTLCLENVENLSQAMQTRLMGAVEAQEEALQDGQPRIRIISTCNSDPDNPKPSDTLRPELFYRLTGLGIDAPALRDRGEDILMLFNKFSHQFAEEYGCEAPEITSEHAAQLLQRRWDGNVRQLINLAERAVLVHRRDATGLSALLGGDKDARDTEHGEKPLKQFVEAFEKMMIENSLKRHRGSVAQVIEELSLPRRTLNEKMAKYGLSRGDYA